MCCLCIQFTHENTSECTILHLVKNNFPGSIACTANLNTAANVLKIKNLKFLNRFRKTTILDFPDKNQEEQS
jgi:hypothetical protein